MIGGKKAKIDVNRVQVQDLWQKTKNMTRGVKTKLTPAQWEKMGRMALDGCQDGTIASAMEIPKQTISDSKEIRTFLLKKRGQRYWRKRKEQDKHAKTSPAMSIFQGKNELGQADKREDQVSGDIHVHIRD